MGHTDPSTAHTLGTVQLRTRLRHIFLDAGIIIVKIAVRISKGLPAEVRHLADRQLYTVNPQSILVWLVLHDPALASWCIFNTVKTPCSAARELVIKFTWECQGFSRVQPRLLELQFRQSGPRVSIQQLKIPVKRARSTYSNDPGDRLLRLRMR